MLVCIEGNIGAGKTTLITELRALDYNVVHENVLPRLLELFYAQPDKYAFVLQMVASASRLSIINSELLFGGSALTFLDRSIVGDYAFAAANYVLGNLSCDEFLAYRESVGGSLKEVVEMTLPKSASIVYLRVSPEECAKRVVARDGVDASVSLEYLRVISAAHELAIDIVQYTRRVDVTDSPSARMIAPDLRPSPPIVPRLDGVSENIIEALRQAYA